MSALRETPSACAAAVDLVGDERALRAVEAAGRRNYAYGTQTQTAAEREHCRAPCCADVITDFQ